MLGWLVVESECGCSATNANYDRGGRGYDQADMDIVFCQMPRSGTVSKITRAMGFIELGIVN